MMSDPYSLVIPASAAFWNIADSDGTITLSNSDRTATVSGSGYKEIRANIGRSSGKWYFETAITGGSNLTAATPGIGVSTTVHLVTDHALIANGVTAIFGDGKKTSNGSSATAYGLSLVGATLMIALDLDNSKFWAGTGGTWFASGDPAAGTNAAFTSGLTGTYYPILQVSSAFSIAVTGQWHSSHLSFTVPTGFTPWAGG